MLLERVITGRVSMNSKELSRWRRVDIRRKKCVRWDKEVVR